ncbi:MAG: hypothetical protein OEQ29_17630 [Alphaproteobacteria bacterium]|nr:hypothetical protein [Alphaproteobacteria bacterium]
MTRTPRATLIALGTALGLAVLPLTVAQSANAAIAANLGISPATSQPNVILAGTCWKRMGPCATQDRAWRYIRALRARGYQTSGVWGVGGSIAYSYSSRKYYFRVFYRC